jgi:hypothetical protein
VGQESLERVEPLGLLLALDDCARSLSGVGTALLDPVAPSGLLLALDDCDRCLSGADTRLLDPVVPSGLLLALDRSVVTMPPWVAGGLQFRRRDAGTVMLP